jgi:RNA polymerase sigma factor (sigma-70 family)
MPIDATLTRPWQERLRPQRRVVQRRVECQQRGRRPHGGWRSPERSQDMTEQDQRIGEVVEREQSRLRNFIRRRVPDPLDAEDVLQDVFYKLVEANRLLMPIDHVTGWLFRVARNRITDLFRKKRPVNFSELEATDEEGERLEFEDLLPARGKGAMTKVAEPEAEFLRGVLLEALEETIAALPPEQREVFIAHELEGRSFAEMAREKSISVNTLLARKRYAVLHLRERLREVYEEWEK